MSTEFKWNSKDFSAMYATCATDDAVMLTIKNIPSKKSRILEAGAGTGRVVKYLYDLGYKNVERIELNKEAVKNFKKKFPKIKMVQGDILKSPYRANSFDVVVAYGVVEHFTPGLQEPMVALRRILKKNGVALISVPSMNLIRRTQYSFERFTDLWNPYHRKTRNRGKYYIHPQFGDFFEYRLTKKEFIKAAQKAKFKVIESMPIYHVDGMYHIFGSKLVTYKNYKFYFNKAGRLLNEILMKIPFAHNHMHMLILKKG